jgi:uncharacterized DUF497 family protein
MIKYYDMFFDWDQNKAKSNVRKHGITFLEAMTAFRDINALVLDDGQHSVDEERFILLGMSKETNLLLVCHCYRGDDDVVRLISARKANSHEAKEYGGK